MGWNFFKGRLFYASKFKQYTGHFFTNITWKFLTKMFCVDKLKSNSGRILAHYATHHPTFQYKDIHSSNIQVTHRCIPDFWDIAQNPTCLPYTPLSWVQGVEMWTPQKLNSFWIGCRFKNICPVNYCGCWVQK